MTDAPVPPKPSGGDTVGADPQGVPTYQELLDEALQETFPASDPISPNAAMSADERISTGRDDTDWVLKPGSEKPSIHDRGGEQSSPASAGAAAPANESPFPTTASINRKKKAAQKKKA